MIDDNATTTEDGAGSTQPARRKWSAGAAAEAGAATAAGAAGTAAEEIEQSAAPARPPSPASPPPGLARALAPAAGSLEQVLSRMPLAIKLVCLNRSVS